MVLTLGKVEVTEEETEIDGATYRLTFRVMPEGSIPQKILLGEDLQNHTVIQLDLGQPVVFPTEAYVLQVEGEKDIQLPSLEHLGKQDAQEV